MSKYSVCVLFVLVAGCTVNANEWAAAEVACQANGGVRAVASDTGTAFCKNGAIFYSTSEEMMRAKGAQK